MNNEPDLTIRLPLGNGLVAVMKIDDADLMALDGSEGCPPESTYSVVLVDVEKPPPRKVTKIQLQGPITKADNSTYKMNLMVSIDLETSD